MTTAAYFECFSGASGDMILGALLDAGWPEAAFREALARVPLGDWEADVRQVKKGALHATQVTLRVTAPQPERDVRDILPVIAASGLPEAVKERAAALFRELADVEGLEHDQPPETVHFHEVGAVDSILDIVGACAGLHALGIERLYVSPINVGGGTVSTRDGVLPVPGPAALELLRRKGAPLYASEYGPEFLTPTGALVLATLADGFGPFPPMRVERIGYGAGQKDFAVPNVLRLSVGTLYAGWRRYGAGRGGLPAAPTGPAGLAGLAGRAGRARPAQGGEEQAPGHGHAHEHEHDHPGGAGEHDHPGGAGEHDHPGGAGEQEQDDGALAALSEREDLVVQLETNVDDMNPEWYGHLGERLLAEGALDVTLIPALMKKGRPGTLVSVLVRPEGVEPALGTLFAETTTLGVRIREVARRTLDRRLIAVETPYGRVRVKLGLLDGAVRSAAPEYEDCRAAARQAGVPLRRVYEAASRAAEAIGA